MSESSGFADGNRNDVPFTIEPPQTGQNVFPVLMSRFAQMPAVDAMFTLMEMGELAEAGLALFSDQVIDQVLLRSMDDEELRKNDDVHLKLSTEQYGDKKRDCTSCAVCLEDFSSEDEVKSLTCNHVFHVPCITDWGKYKQDCPVCRRKIEYEVRIGTMAAEQQNRSPADVIKEITGADDQLIASALNECGTTVDALMLVTNMMEFV